MIIEFTIPGTPQGKARPRLGKSRVYTPTKTVKYEKLIQFYAYQAMKGKPIFDWAVTVNMYIFMQRPRSWSNKKYLTMNNAEFFTPITKPDIDNVIKVVFDAINKIVWNDDKQVTALKVTKLYTNDPRIVVKVEKLNYKGF